MDGHGLIKNLAVTYLVSQPDAAPMSSPGINKCINRAAAEGHYKMFFK